MGLAAAFLLSNIGQDRAGAHYRIDWQKWYFGGFTHKSTAGTTQSRSDPVNIMFWGWGTASNANVMDHLNSEWDHPWWKPWKAMDDWGCLTTYSYHVAGPQYMVFKESHRLS